MVCPCGRPQIFFIKEQIYLQAISWANNPACFIAGTLVLAKEGKKAIESIEPGDEVLAYDEATGDMQYKKVARVFRNTTDKWCTVTVEVNGKTEKITSTPGHKYYLPFNSENREKDLIPEHANYITLSDKWVSACKLKPGDNVLLFNKTYAIIKAIEVVCLSTPEITYNFEVEDFHTYFVGDNPILVHNKNCNLIENDYSIKEDGVKVEVRAGEGPGKVAHSKPHAHVLGNGPSTTVGLDKMPVNRAHPQLSSKQRNMVYKNWDKIVELIKKVWK